MIYIYRLINIDNIDDIPSKYADTPIEVLLSSHNMGVQYDTFCNPELLIGMCMDNRKTLKTPDNFAYILRTGGGNLRYSEFKVSYCIAVGGVNTIALIAHNDCGMVNLIGKKDKFISGLVNAGWDETSAENHFEEHAHMYEIHNELDFVLSETKRIRERYPRILIAPLFYNVNDCKLYLINEE